MRFKTFESVFDVNSDYWLKKTKVPKSLQRAIQPHTDKGLRVLDLGCGGGRLAKSISPHFSSVHGIDSSPELIKMASQDNPNINYVCANFQSSAAWNSLGNFDVIVSNCAIRKDYCEDLNKVADLCYDHLNVNGEMILRIQAFEDLNDLLPESIRASLFYGEKEVRRNLSGFSQTKIEHETYKQKFSSEDYIRQFLQRIQINYEGPIRILQPTRHYYIVRASR